MMRRAPNRCDVRRGGQPVGLSPPPGNNDVPFLFSPRDVDGRYLYSSKQQQILAKGLVLNLPGH